MTNFILEHKIRTSLKSLFSAMVKRDDINLDYDLFTLFLMNCSHELVSPDKRSLMESFTSIQKTLGEAEVDAFFA
jgi:hypothetical protein